MLTVFGMRSSGNCYKLQLLLEHLARPYRWVEVDVAAGETRRPEFLRLNPNGKVPLLQLDSGTTLAESNAILGYLAEGSDYLPRDSWSRAKVHEWLFFEQYSHEPAIAVARYIRRFLPADHPRRRELPRLLERGHQALRVMDGHLASQTFFAGTRYSIADMALYAYTHCAADGGFQLEYYPAVQRWLARVAAQPGFSPMQNPTAAPGGTR